MKVAHEALLDLMETVMNHTDYDYFLAHLMYNDSYQEHFQESKKRGRHSILDNSVFELGKAFDAEEYARLVQEWQPTEYIIPDSIGNHSESVRLVNEWIDKYSASDMGSSKAIGVVQGKTLPELTSSYWYLATNPRIHKIAFAFMSDAYETLFFHPNKQVQRALGRVSFLSHLLKKDVIDKGKPHHLLSN